MLHAQQVQWPCMRVLTRAAVPCWLQLLRIETAWKGTPPPFAKLDGNYHHSLVGLPPRADIKPLDIVQPEGPSFTVRALPPN